MKLDIQEARFLQTPSMKSIEMDELQELILLTGQLQTHGSSLQRTTEPRGTLDNFPIV